jgi:hypothetical protein
MFGYKHRISQSMACDLFKNLLYSLRTYKQGVEEFDLTAKKIQLFFTHGGDILSFYSALEIAKNISDFDKDTILTENKNRSFRTSLLDPMNSNIAFILYQCFQFSNNQIVSKYTIRVFLNEKLIKLARCSSVDCDLNEFFGFYEQFVNQCGSTKQACTV